MSTLATWDNITGALGSTNTSFGGDWGNLISDFFNGINLALNDPTKVPRINTLTRFKHEKLGLFDGDESHDILFSADDIDTGPTRKIKIRRMNTPFETDYMLMESLPATILNKTIDFDLNTGSNISNSHIKTGAGIIYAKLNLSNSILNADINTSAAIATSKLAEGSLFLKSNVSNIFTVAQSIEGNNLFPLTLYRTSNIVNSSNIIAFDSQNSASTRKTYAQMNVFNAGITVASEFAEFRLTLLQAGTLSNMLSLSNSILNVGVSPTRFSLDPVGITTPRTYTFQNASGKLPLLEFANIFTTTQKIQYGATQALTLYHPTSVLSNGTGIGFNLQNATPTEISYAAIYAINNDNVVGSEKGSLAFYARNGASLVDRMLLTSDNKLRIGVLNSGVVIDPTGISGTNKNFTYPNLSGEVQTLNAAQIPINKTLDVRTNILLRMARSGMYHCSSESGVDAEGVLRGLVSLGDQGVTIANTGGTYHIWNSKAVINDAAGVVKLDNFVAWRITNPLLRFAFLFVANTGSNRRMFKGWTAKRLLSTDTDTIPLLSTESGFVFGHGAADTQFQIWHNDATGVCVKTSTGVNLPGANTNYILEISISGSSFTWTLYNVSGITQERSTIVGTGTISTRTPPLTTTTLYLQDLVIPTTAAIQPNNIHYIEVFN